MAVSDRQPLPLPSVPGPVAGVPEQVLDGGFTSRVVRISDTVRKEPPPNPAFVRRLLAHFEQHGWAGAPRYLGTDDKGREVLTFLVSRAGNSLKI
jgi:hypothetical protein